MSTWAHQLEWHLANIHSMGDAYDAAIWALFKHNCSDLAAFIAHPLFNVNYFPPPNGKSLLQVGVERSNLYSLPSMEMLIEAKADCSQVNLVKIGNEEIVELLLSKGNANPNLIPRNASTLPLHAALSAKKVALTKLFIKFGADIGLETPSGHTIFDKLTAGNRTYRKHAMPLAKIMMERGRASLIPILVSAGLTKDVSGLVCEWLFYVKHIS